MSSVYKLKNYWHIIFLLILVIDYVTTNNQKWNVELWQRVMGRTCQTTVKSDDCHSALLQVVVKNK